MPKRFGGATSGRVEIDRFPVAQQAGPGSWRRRARGSARGLLEALEVTTSARPRLPYVGPARSRNAGDALLHEAHQRLLAPVVLPPLQTLTGAKGASWVVRPSTVLLGGGTLVGEPKWRRVLEAVDGSGRADLWNLGTGVLDPQQEGFGWVHDELRSWMPLLRRMEPVAVRGPSSAAVLADLGIDCTVVGDPVLALSPDHARQPVPGLLGLNIGVTRAVRTFGTDAAAADAYAGVARWWQARGGTVRLFSVWPPDDALCRRVIDQAGLHDAELVSWTGDLQGYLQRLQQCELVVAQKLHAAVLTVVADRPVIAVEYQSKCRDFMASLELEAWSRRMDECSAASLIALVGDAHAVAPTLVAGTAVRRRALREALAVRARAVTEGMTHLPHP